jgi:hypothetical protein
MRLQFSQKVSANVILIANRRECSPQTPRGIQTLEMKNARAIPRLRNHESHISLLIRMAFGSNIIL